MSLVDRVIRVHLGRSRKMHSERAVAEEVRRVEQINSLSLEEFHELPREDQEFAEELWTARVLEVNARREDERVQRVMRELALEE